jgi:hypothetical protein
MLPGLQRGRKSDDASDCDSDARELTRSGTRIERPMIWAIQMTVEMMASTSTPMPPNSLKTPATNSTVRTGMTQSGILSRLFMRTPFSLALLRHAAIGRSSVNCVTFLPQAFIFESPGHDGDHDHLGKACAMQHWIVRGGIANRPSRAQAMHCR